MSDPVLPPNRCAVAYLRTSSAANVGADKDSEKRQRDAVASYAGRNGYAVRQEFYDAAVSGADRIDARGGFADMLAWCDENDCRTIIVESASRFARDLIVQETGFEALKAKGFTLIAADDPDAFTAETPTRIMVRQILGAVSQFEKASLVAKMRAARDRKSAEQGGRIEGPKLCPKQVATAKAIAAEGASLRTIAARMAEQGFLTGNGTVLSAAHVRRLVNAPASRLRPTD